MKCTLCSENLPQRPGAVCAGPEHAGGQASHRMATGEPALIRVNRAINETVAKFPCHLYLTLRCAAAACAGAGGDLLLGAGDGGGGRALGQVSCDWCRAGHVITILLSDWSRIRENLASLQLDPQQLAALPATRLLVRSALASCQL